MTFLHRLAFTFSLSFCALTRAALAATAPAPAAMDDAERAKLRFFENEIRPVLVNRCYECHGEKKQKGSLRLDHMDHILKGGSTGPALVPGKPAESLLITAIHYKDEDLQMPPKEQLPPKEVALLEKWIELGAPWPAGEGTRSNVDQYGFTPEDRQYWFFQPLTDPKPPALPAATAQWARGGIDRFIAAKHAEFGLTPAPEADRAEFARRLYFDLHGLPPTPMQLNAFVADNSPQAYERLVDELLASPRYGERWAQHWLDLVRYAESDGYRADAYRPGAWPYRDYVIKSLNADKPYDQFVREQLAGDELAPGNPEVLVATSYLRNPVYEWNQRDVRGQADLIVTDLTDNAGEVFLGLSFGCARCHDHKFDPILQKDYFALRAFFEPVLWRSDLKLATREEQARHAEKLAAWETATAEIRREMEELVGAARTRLVKIAHDRFTADLQSMMDKPVAERAPLEHVLASIAERQLTYEVERFEPQKALKAPDAKKRYAELEVALKKFDSLKPAPLPEAFVATDVGSAAPVTKMKSRKGGEREVTPAFMTLIDPAAPAIKPLPGSTGRRTALAQWITRPDNQLATRVIVNRVWHYHFGRGLAATPNDLGHLGDRPTHPELIDWLARRFVAGGWSLKSLHRDIVLSATYRQTARHPADARAALVDPANKYLWRFTPRRLDAEQARDAMLAATGELDFTLGGPSLEANSTARRSIYTIKRRNNPNEFLRSLDAPPGFTSIADRSITSTPLQALLFLNGDWPLARARQLGAQSTSVDTVWQSTLGRAPTAEEKQLATAYIDQRTAGPGRPISDKPDLSLSAASTSPAAVSTARTDLVRFHENTPHERILVRHAPREGDDFTVEAVVTVDSVDAGASVRVIASRWAGDRSSPDSHGWALGVTGKKSAYKPLNVIMQLVGEDENMNTTYEVVASGLPLTVGTRYHIVARVSCSDGNVAFQVRDLTQPDAAPRTATQKHAIIGKLGTGSSLPAIGGLARRSPNQFDGQIEALRVAPGLLADDMLSADPARWPATGALAWAARRPLPVGFEWQAGVSNAESSDPFVRAMTDLAHVLLNSNEFLYLH